MPNGCLKAVHSAGKILAKLNQFPALCTHAAKYLTSQVFFVRSLYSVYKQVFRQYTQPKRTLLPLINLFLPHYPQGLLILLN
jgi:hypothetical protein